MPGKTETIRQEIVSAKNIWEAANNNKWANTFEPTKETGKYLCRLIKIIPAEVK